MEFLSSIEEVSPVLKRVKVTVPPQVLSSKVEELLRKFSTRAKIKGFRPGKAPRHIIEQQYAAAAFFEAVDALVNDSLDSVIRENHIEFIGRPEVDFGDVGIQAWRDQKGFEYTATLSLFPKPEITGYDSIEVTVPRAEVKEEQIANSLELFRKQKASTRPVEGRDMAQKGDVYEVSVRVALAGTKEKSPYESLTFSEEDERIPAEVKSLMEGMQIGEEREVSLKLGHNHPYRKLRGKKVTYQVKLLGLQEKVLPEINDEFAATIKEGKSLEEIREWLKENLQKRVDKEVESTIDVKILEVLAEKNQFEVPHPLVHSQYLYLLQQYGVIKDASRDYSKLSLETFPSVAQVAKKQVISSLIVERIQEQENLTPSEDEVKAKFQEMSPEEAQWYQNAPDALQEVEKSVARDKTLKFLRERAKVTYTDAPQEEVPSQQEALVENNEHSETVVGE